MGSGKGTQTQQQSYVASPQIQAAGTQALNQAQSAAQLPFNLPTAPVAGFNPTQQQAFAQTLSQQGMAQPYYNQAQNLFNMSAAPISGSQISNYLNPYAGNVLDQLRSQQGAQMADLTGKATQTAGGIGADRIGVAQGQLANQQSLATGATLSGIYGQALSAAQQDAQRQQSAAYGIGNLGGAAQNAAMQGTNALLATGNQAQGLTQAQLNAPYQNQLAQAAFPYQQAQYLAGVTGNLAGAFGGTTYGQMTPAQPSPYSQIAGLGTGLAGAYGAYNSLYGSGGNNIGPTSVGGAPLAKDGGRIGYDNGGGVGGGVGEAAWMNADPVIPTMQMHPAQVNQPKLNWNSGSQDNIGSDIGNIASAAAKIAPLFMANRGGSVYSNKFADGGDSFNDRFDPAYSVDPTRDANFAAGADMLRAGMGTRAPNSIPGGEPAPINPDQPYRMTSPDAVQAWRDNASPPTKFTVNPTAAPTLKALHEDEDTPAPGTSPYGGSTAARDTATANMAAMKDRTYAVPYPDAVSHDTSRDFAKSPWLALMNAGFGMMAGTSPYAGVNIGKGLLAGTQTLEKQREQNREDENVNQRATQLGMQAKQHLDAMTKMTPYQAAELSNKQQQLEQNGWQKGGERLDGSSVWFNPYSQESGVLTGGGQWIKGGASNQMIMGANGATGGPGVNPQTAQQQPEAPPPPLGVPALASQNTAPTLPPPSLPKAQQPIINNQTKLIDAELQKKAASLPELENNLVSMKSAYATLMKDGDKDGFLTKLTTLPGANFGDRIERAKQLNAAAYAAKQPPPINPDKLAAAEEIAKIQQRMGASFAAQLSSRPAFAMEKIGINATPGATNSPVGFLKIIPAFDAAVQNTKDQVQSWSDWQAKNPYRPNEWRAHFMNTHSPDMYYVRTTIDNIPSQRVRDELPKAVARLKADPSQENISGFNRVYGGTASYFLTGKMAPYQSAQ